jgi:hypothetical protein
MGFEPDVHTALEPRLAHWVPREVSVPRGS